MCLGGAVYPKQDCIGRVRGSFKVVLKKKPKSPKLKLNLQLPDLVQLLTVNRVKAVTQIRGKTPLVSVRQLKKEVQN